MKWFRRRRTITAPTRLAVSEAIAASAWGIDEYEWLRLTDRARAHARANITHAPNFTGATQ
jgi:hypothetical protein